MKRGLTVIAMLAVVAISTGVIALLRADRAGDRSVRWHLVDEAMTTATDLKVLVLVGDRTRQ